MISDAVIRRAQHGDPFAMDEVMRFLTPKIGPICGSIALDAGDDAMQETLIVILRRISTLREPRALTGWARQIATREAVRTARRRVPVVDDATLEAAGPAVELSDIATALDVRRALGALAPEQRAVLVLRDLEGLTEAEVARVLDVPEGTVKSRLHRSRAAFAQRWNR